MKKGKGSLEEKIRAKAKNIFGAYQYRDKGMASEGNKNTFLDDMVNAMLRIIRTEVNIRLQEERHRERNYDPKKS